MVRPNIKINYDGKEMALHHISKRGLYSTPSDECSFEAFKGQLFYSLYTYNSELEEYLLVRKTIKGFDGDYTITRIIIDFDGIDLEKVKDEVLRFAEMLQVDYGLEETDFNIYFSGSKGFHVAIKSYLISSITPSTDLSGKIKNFVKTLTKDFKFVDLVIYDKSRLIRAVNSINEKSNLYKIILFLPELKYLTMDEIKALAKYPRFFIDDDIENAQPNSKLTELYDKSNSSSISETEIEKLKPKYPDRLFDVSQVKLACEVLAGKIDDYSDYKDVLCSLASLGEEGRELTQIALKNYKFPEDTPEDLDSAFNRFLNWYDPSIKNKIGIGTLFFIAEQYGYKYEVKFTLDDVGNSEVFIHHYGGLFCFIREFKQWYLWNGKVWVEDKESRVFEKIKSLSDVIKKEHFDKDSLDPEYLKSFNKHISKVRSKRAIEDCNFLSQRDPRIVRSSLIFDNKPYFFNCQNGTIVLNSDGTHYLKEHDKEDYLTQISNVKYEPTAKPDKWLKFMNVISNGNEEIILYLQKAIGYSMTGNTDEDTLFFLFGSGANGKSTFLDTIEYQFGDYHKKTNIDTLIKNKGEKTGMDLLRLKGARFVSSSEIKIGTSFDEGKIKDLTGGDTITARNIFQLYTQFKPQFKLWILGNHKPRIKGNDHGIRRRIKIIPFIVQIPKEQQVSRSQLFNEFKEEASGILNWFLEGYLLYKTQGLTVPDSIARITDEYFKASDLVGRFIDERVELVPNENYGVQDLYNAFALFLTDAGEYKWSMLALNNEMLNREFEKRRIGSKGYRWIGLTLKVPETWSEEVERSIKNMSNVVPPIIPPTNPFEPLNFPRV